MKIHLDFETRSPAPLSKTGHYAYAFDFDTDVWCMAWAYPEGEVNLWLPGDPIPEEFYEAELHGWNVSFERIIWNVVMVRQHGARKIPLERWYDTAVDAAALALPRGLGDAATVLGLGVEKDMDGRRLMLQMSRPRTTDPYTWWDDDDRKERLFAYCRRDVEVERAIAKALKPISSREREVYLMDQRMNDRGILIDVPLVEACQDLMETSRAIVQQELEDLTDGKVDAVTKTARMIEWAKEHGVVLPNLQKDTVRDILLQDDDDLPKDVRQVLQLRQDHGKSSVAKLEALRYYAGPDNRARGMVLFHGASTGRWSGKGPQPQNLPRPSLHPSELEAARGMVLTGSYSDIERTFGPVPIVISSLLRSCFRAGPGKVLRGADYAQIEARVLAWIAGQQDLVDLFASGGKVYEEMASFIYGIPVDEVGKDSFERFIGKNTILGAGYQMGAKTFMVQTQRQSGVVLEKEQALQAIRGYRNKNAAIAQFWYEINGAATDAVYYPGERFTCGRDDLIEFIVKGSFLWCVLPSKRLLAYALPQVEEVTVTYEELETGEEKTFTTESVTFCGVNSTTKRWERRPAYGGLWTENVVQAMARDLLASAKLRLEAAGYSPVLTVHDEVVTEDRIGFGSIEEMEHLMTTLPRWATGLPVSVEAWQGERYRK